MTPPNLPPKETPDAEDPPGRPPEEDDVEEVDVTALLARLDALERRVGQLETGNGTIVQALNDLLDADGG